MTNRILCLGGLLALAVAYFAVYPVGFDPDSSCVGNARIVNIALQEYVQDSDEVLPPMHKPAVFQSALEPYVSQPSRFVCPDTGQAYKPHSAVGGRTLPSFSRTDNVMVFEDAVPHADGTKMVSYLDGHVSLGGVIQPVDGNQTQLCIDNVRDLGIGLDEYVQDYDEKFPPLAKPSALRSALLPYVKNPKLFNCPVTGKRYTANSGLSEKLLVDIPDPSAIFAIEDSVPHSDGIRTIGYLDGHVTHGSMEIGGPTDTGNLVNLGVADNRYLQDYDLMLPPLSSYPAFQAALSPYVGGSSAVFVQPSSGLNYTLNSALNGDSINSIADPSASPLASDPQINPDGSDNTLYVDGHVAVLDYLVPLQLTTAPQSGDPALVWANAAGEATIDDLSSTGAVSNQITYDHPTPPAAATAGFNPLLPPLYTFYPASLSRVATISGDSRQLVWGRYEIWNTSASGAVQTQNYLGPYDEWSNIAIAGNGGAQSQALWSNYDGQLALWTLNAQGGYQSDVRLSPASSMTALGMVVGQDGNTRILLSEPGAIADVWTVAPSGNILSETRLAGNSGASVAGIAITPGNTVLLLWNIGNSSAVVQTLSSDGTVASEFTTTVGSGWSPAQLVVENHGDDLILWQQGAAATLERVQSDGTIVYTRQFDPYL